MGPVEDSALGIPGVFAAQAYAVAGLHVDPRGERDVVGDEQGHAVGETHHEPLMWVSDAVVGKDPLDHPLYLDQLAGTLLGEEVGNGGLASGGARRGRLGGGQRPELAGDAGERQDQEDAEDEALRSCHGAR